MRSDCRRRSPSMPAGTAEMTELEEAELTDGQGRALSAHKSRAYEATRSEQWNGALAATGSGMTPVRRLVERAGNRISE